MISNISNEKPSPGLQEFVVEFYEDRVLEFQNIVKNMEGNNFEAVRQMAHKWKGFCEPYGFQGLGYLSSDLEKSSENKDLEASFDIISKMGLYLEEKGELLNLKK